MTDVKKVGIWGYIKAAFNARPIGMFVPPNWVGIVALALAGLVNPGIWAVGAGLEVRHIGAYEPRQRAAQLAPVRRQGRRHEHEAEPERGEGATRSARRHVHGPTSG